MADTIKKGEAATKALNYLQAKTKDNEELAALISEKAAAAPSSAVAELGLDLSKPKDKLVAAYVALQASELSGEPAVTVPKKADPNAPKKETAHAIELDDLGEHVRAQIHANSDALMQNSKNSSIRKIITAKPSLKAVAINPDNASFVVPQERAIAKMEQMKKQLNDGVVDPDTREQFDKIYAMLKDNAAFPAVVTDKRGGWAGLQITDAQGQTRIFTKKELINYLTFNTAGLIYGDPAVKPGCKFRQATARTSKNSVGEKNPTPVIVLTNMKAVKDKENQWYACAQEKDTTAQKTTRSAQSVLSYRVFKTDDQGNKLPKKGTEGEFQTRTIHISGKIDVYGTRPTSFSVPGLGEPMNGKPKKSQIKKNVDLADLEAIKAMYIINLKQTRTDVTSANFNLDAETAKALDSFDTSLKPVGADETV